MIPKLVLIVLMQLLCLLAALQIESDVERNTAVYGSADVSAVLEGTTRPPEPFRDLIDALIALEK